VRPGLGPGAEFDLIRSFLDAGAALPPGVVVGPGDDAAVLEGGWVVSTDLSVEDVHFRRAWLTDEEIGYRAAAAALSDLAAMGARPTAVLVSTAASRDGAVDLPAVQRGVRAAAASVGAAVVGGDLSASPGPLFLDLVVLGRADRPVLRSGSRAGDEVWVTGRLGSGAAALGAWASGREPAPEARARFVRPEPRVGIGADLAVPGGATAMVDLSDGLAGDAGHIAAASSVRVVLEEGRLPLDSATVDALGVDAAREAALHGGEDFELCLTAAPGAFDPTDLERRHGVPLTRVGRVEAGSGVWLQGADGSLREAPRGGYDHWGVRSPGRRGSPEARP